MAIFIIKELAYQLVDISNIIVCMSQIQNQPKALELKEQGNALFKIKNYEVAIEKYNEAISFCPKISVLYSNKARCYKELKDYEKSYQSAAQAVKIDDKNIKAYFLMGESLVEIAMNSKDKKKIEQAIEQLKKSLRLCPSQGKIEFEERFVDQIYKAKKKLWFLQVEANQDKKKLLRSYLANVVETDMEINQQEKDALHQNICVLIQKKYCGKEPIPQSLVCYITKTIMKDPVCNQYGNSYSKKAYLAQIAKNGRLDPITSKPIKTNIIYPNINLKKAIDHFLQKNPWAYEEKIE